jgi:4-hydroxybenzoate polyprenyltransferase
MDGGSVIAETTLPPTDGREVRDPRPFLARLIPYQAERFPIIQHAPLIAVFTFAAVSYSRVCRGVGGFIPIEHYLVGAFTAITFFLFLRIADEFKDFEEDARWRPYRAVPRGLVSLPELARLALVVMILQVIANALVIPSVLPYYLPGIIYLILMSKEFFIGAWLRRHPIIYMLSHMAILPMIDLYTTGLDWAVESGTIPTGLEFFLVVTYLNGIVIELGRKIRAPESEEPGVETYSALYGARRATYWWIAAVITGGLASLAAAAYAGFALEAGICMQMLAIFTILPAIRFIRTPNPENAKRLELAAGIWTIGMYLILGGLPMVLGKG